MFELAGSELEFTDGALHEIARKALARDTGARALRGVVEDLMLEIMYRLPEPGMKGRYVINGAVARGEKSATAEPIVEPAARRKESA